VKDVKDADAANDVKENIILDPHLVPVTRNLARNAPRNAPRNLVRNAPKNQVKNAVKIPN
jgi:hypothetical protein